MRGVYITVTILLVLSIFLFIASFIYLEKESHKIYYYTVNLDGYDVGGIKIDRFVTEDKLIYKSASSIPFQPIYTDSEARIDVDRRYNLETYFKERSADRVREIVYLENKKDRLLFVATFDAEFASLDDISIREGTFVLEEDSPVTYLPILENYDFKKGRSQGFNAITQFSPSLPPMKRFITLTSTRDEYMTIDAKKIKTECLWLKIKNYPQCSVWVSKADRSLVALEIPHRNLKITRTFSPKSFEAKEYTIKSEEYITREASFKNKNVLLAGALTAPAKEGKYPAALLIWDDGPHDRNYQGLFASIADYLSRNGFCVLRLDKRGVGSSSGDHSSTTDSDIIEDLSAALEFLRGQKEVDPQRIFLIGHLKGAFYASQLASKNSVVKGIVLMAPLAHFRVEESDIKFDGLRKTASTSKWSSDYLKLAVRSNLEIRERVENSKGSWASILGYRCFLRKMKEELTEKPIESIKNIKIPVLILQGKGDDSPAIESAATLDRALEEAGNQSRTLTYFGYLGSMLGARVNDGRHRIYYKVDAEVLEAIKGWMGKKDLTL